MTTRGLLVAFVLCAVVLGFVASQTHSSAEGTPPSPLRLSGSWHSAAGGVRSARVWVGASVRNAASGVAIVETGPSGRQGAISLLRDDGDGALSILEAPARGGTSLTLRSARGNTYDLAFGLSGVSLTPLGRKLDSTSLPDLPARGLAIDTRYGPYRRHAVVLARLDPGAAIAPIGYLDGWRVAGAGAPGRQFPVGAPPLLADPRGTVFSLRAAQLKRAATTVHPTSFAARRGAHAQCALKGALLRCSDREPLTVDVRPGHADLALVSAWPSPDLRTLLVQGVAGCDDSAHEAYFLPIHGGALMPVVAGPGVGGSTALGWLRTGEALVSVESSSDCGSAPSGIYRIAPGSEPALVVPTLSRAFVLWGGV